jgi:LuxR family maltose regulon positive regulatory protein
MITRATRVWLESILKGGTKVIEDVKEIIEEIPDTNPFYRLMLMVLGQAYEEINDLPKARETYLQGISLVEDWTTTRGLLDVIQGVAISEFELSGISPTMEWAEKLETTAAKYEEQIGLPVAYRKYALALQALVSYEKNQLDLCTQYCQQALEAAKHTREPYNRAMHDAYHLMVKATLANDDTVMAAHWLDLNSQAVENEILSPLIKNFNLQSQIEYWIHLGDHAKLQSWATEKKLDLDATPAPEDEEDYLLLACWTVQYQDPRAVLLLLDVIFENASKRKHLRTVVRALALKSLALQKLGQQSEAISTMETALDYAESGGYVRSILDMGPGVLDLLLIMVGQKNKHPYLDDLLRHARQDLPNTPAPNALTERELDVLGLIAQGLSNNDIADQLVIAVGTVKRHTANIYSKLYASNRTEAVAKARESGYLD